MPCKKREKSVKLPGRGHYWRDWGGEPDDDVRGERKSLKRHEKARKWRGQVGSEQKTWGSEETIA